MNGHGGNIYMAAGRLGIKPEKITDFSASINPLGLPKSGLAAIRNSLNLLGHYPEPFAETLASDIAEHHGLSPASVICGNGSTELIYLIPRVLKPRRVLIHAPTFSEYEKACSSLQPSAFSLQELKKENNFDLDPNDYIKAMKDCDLAFLCNPNNPTGRLLPRKDVLKIASAAKKMGCYLVVDEAFMDFCPGESVINAVRRNPYLIVLRSLTKFYAMAGLRLGFGVFHSSLADRVNRLKEPWTVNSVADAAGRAALTDDAYRMRSERNMKIEKGFLEKGLDALGIWYLPSAVNYYLLKMGNADIVISRLAEKGLLIRDCSNFRGLGKGYVRIAVRTRAENERLLKELSRL